MNRLILSLLVFAVLFQAVSRCFAQEIPLPIPLTKQQKLLTSALMGPALNSFLTQHRPGMLGLCFAMNPMFKAGFEKEYGFSGGPEFVMEKFKEKFEGSEEIREEMVAFGQVMQQIMERAEQNPDAESLELSEEEIFAIQKGYDKIFDGFAEIATEVFTPEQMEKVKELEFAVFGGIESPMFCVDSMEILDLTDEQIKELEEFQQDIADEKLEMIDGLAEFTTKVLKSGKLNMQEAEAFEAKYKGLTNKIGARLREILTEEQLEKATKLVKDQQKKMEKMVGGLGAITQWMPSADSWAPGMPIPDSLKPKESVRRFPKKSKPAEENEK
ncbi:MAG: hypothetical protein FWC43_14380 [Planctomycetaceae bacterium]|nr:hypothetical protein [Planctomycetaceae bacterium]